MARKTEDLNENRKVFHLDEKRAALECVPLSTILHHLSNVVNLLCDLLLPATKVPLKSLLR